MRDRISLVCIRSLMVSSYALTAIMSIVITATYRMILAYAAMISHSTITTYVKFNRCWSKINDWYADILNDIVSKFHKNWYIMSCILYELKGILYRYWADISKNCGYTIILCDIVYRIAYQIITGIKNLYRLRKNSAYVIIIKRIPTKYTHRWCIRQNFLYQNQNFKNQSFTSYIYMLLWNLSHFFSHKYVHSLCGVQAWSSQLCVSLSIMIIFYYLFPWSYKNESIRWF